MGFVRIFHRSYKMARNAGLIVLGATGVLFSFVLSRVFGASAFGSLGGGDAFADAAGYSQSTYGDTGDACCSGGGDSCG